MSEKKKSKKPQGEAPEAVEEVTAPEVEETVETPAAPAEDGLQAQLAAQEEKYLRLCAEYDNYRKRTAKEKESTWSAATGEAVKALLPVYDNLERALKQETADEAYKKGVEMTMAGLKKSFADLGVTEIGAAGEGFDPNIHNAVMHIDDDSLGESTVAEVFQTGFMLGEKVIRFAMVKVAN